MGNGVGPTMRNFIVCIVYLIQSGWMSRRLRWAGHIVRMENYTSSYKILTGKPKQRDLQIGLGVDVRTI